MIAMKVFTIPLYRPLSRVLIWIKAKKMEFLWEVKITAIILDRRWDGVTSSGPARFRTRSSCTCCRWYCYFKRLFDLMFKRSVSRFLLQRVSSYPSPIGLHRDEEQKCLSSCAKVDAGQLLRVSPPAVKCKKAHGCTILGQTYT